VSRLTEYNRSSKEDVVERVLSALHESADRHFPDSEGSDSKRFAKTVFTETDKPKTEPTPKTGGGLVAEKQSEQPSSKVPETLIQDSPDEETELKSELEKALGVEEKKGFDFIAALLLIIFIGGVVFAFYWFSQN
jgi:hypothetical protein